MCRPHSVLAKPAHRPARGSSPGSTRRVHGSQPMDRKPSDSSEFTSTLLSTAYACSRSKVQAASGLILTRPFFSSHVTNGVSVRGRGLVSAHAGHPGLVERQRPAGVTLRRLAAQGGVALVESGAVLRVLLGDGLLGRDVDEVDRQVISDDVTCDEGVRGSGSRCPGRGRRRPERAWQRRAGARRPPWSRRPRATR